MLTVSAASGSRFVAGGAGFTYADVLLAEAMTLYVEMFGEGLGSMASNLERLKEHKGRMCSLPGTCSVHAACRSEDLFLASQHV